MQKLQKGRSKETEEEESLRRQMRKPPPAPQGLQKKGKSGLRVSKDPVMEDTNLRLKEGWVCRLNGSMSCR